MTQRLCLKHSLASQKVFRNSDGGGSHKNAIIPDSSVKLNSYQKMALPFEIAEGSPSY